MKNYVNNRIFKQIALILLVVMVFEFVMPNYSHAADSENGGLMFTPISSMVRTVGDLLISGLQKIFTGDGSISVTEIVSESEEYSSGYETYLNEFIEKARNTKNYYELLNLDFTGSKGSTVSIGGNIEAIEQYLGVSSSKDLGTKYSNDDSSEDPAWVEFIQDCSESKLEELFVFISGAQMEEIIETETIYSIKYGPANIFSGTIPAFDINFINPINTDAIIEENTEDGETSTVKLSSASILRSIISRWYQDLQKIAMIGLLSILVYIAIQMILNSANQSKATYKKMLLDWLVAICIIFILHYIMVFTLNITTSITEMLNDSAVGNNNEDTIMTTLRSSMGDEEEYMEVFGNLIMYIMLVIFSFTFSIQYLRRVIYMAFLTIIAPLIALTYPLDKIKDGQAQAFTMWIREYIFNALIQPIHLMLYVIFVGSATQLVNNYPIYAVVAVGFLIPAEKFFRTMFGFDKATSVNTLGSVAGGALVMKMLNGIKSGPKGPKVAGDDQEGGNAKTRTADTNPLGVLQTGRTTVESSEEQTTVNRTRQSNSQNNGQSQESIETQVQRDIETQAKNNIRNQVQKNIEKKKQNSAKTNIKKPKSNRRKTALKYTLKIGGKAVRTTSRVAGRIAFGTIGLAAMGTTGDLSKTFTGLVGGMAVGKAVGGRIGESITNAPDTTRRIINNAKDTINEGARGETYAKNEKFDREFMESAKGAELVNTYSKESVKQCLMAGVTDPKQMKKILAHSNSEKELKEAIGYNHLAHDCPNGVLYSDDSIKLRNYLATKGINVDEDGAEEIRKKMYEMLK